MKVTNLDFQLGSILHLNSTKITKISIFGNSYFLEAKYANGELGGLVLTQQELDGIFQVNNYELLDLEPVGKQVSFTNKCGDFIIGYCEYATPFEYKVVSSEGINSSGRFYPKGTSFYPKELKII